MHSAFRIYCQGVLVTRMWLLLAAAVAQSQTKYLGPPVGLTLSPTTCGDLPSVLTLPDANITSAAGAKVVAIDICNNLNPRISPSARWQNVTGKVACSCRDDYPAFTVLAGNPTKDSCQSFEAGYGWLYGEPDPSRRLDWMTIPPQSDVPIKSNFLGVQIEDSDGKNKTCAGQTIIQRSNFCFYDSIYEDALIPVNQDVLNATTDLCRTDADENFIASCCVNATINNATGVHVARDIFFAAACDSTTRAVNNGDGKHHSGAEQAWTRSTFAGARGENITAQIKALFDPGSTETAPRTSVGSSGVNQVCTPSGPPPGSTSSAKIIRQQASDTENTRTELHTTCIVPEKLIDADLLTQPNPFHRNVSKVKRWALHMLIGANDNSASLPGGAVAYNPTAYARKNIRLNGTNPTMDAAAVRESLDPRVIAAVRSYSAVRRGSFPAAFYKVTKDTYASQGGTGYSTSDYFRMCPKDYFETGGHPLPSYQWFIEAKEGDKYWKQNYFEKSTIYRFTPQSYTEENRQFHGDAISCTLEPIDGLKFGSPFWTEPPTPAKSATPDGTWGPFETNITNFRLNCSKAGAIQWANIVAQLAGYNNMPTAGNVAPQLIVNQENTRKSNNIFKKSDDVPLSNLMPDFTACDGSKGPVSRGFVGGTSFWKDQQGRLSRTGKATPETLLGSVASSFAALYGIKEQLYEKQDYSGAYAIVSCTDCVQHNHAGAGTLFPDIPVQGSRPRYADLVGQMDNPEGHYAYIGSCDPDEAQGGKSISAPLNSEKVCAVFSGDSCGDITVNKIIGEVNPANLGQFVNQFNYPGPQMSSVGWLNRWKNFNRPPNAPSSGVTPSEQTIMQQQFEKVGDWSNDATRRFFIQFSNSICGTGNRKKSVPCDPRHYDVSPEEGRYGCTNARVRGKLYHDYSVWPFVSSTDASGNVSSTEYRLLVPSGLFVRDSSISMPPTMTEAQFLAKAQFSGNNPYAKIRQLSPTSRSCSRSNPGQCNETNFQNRGIDACQCFVGPNDADGLGGGTKWDGCGFDLADKGNALYECKPSWQALIDSGAIDPVIAERWAGTKRDCIYDPSGGVRPSTCWTTNNPQSPGPLPQTPGWNKKDLPLKSNTTTSPPRWWTDALPGVPAVRAGILLLMKIGQIANYSPQDIFNKRLYIVHNPDKAQFGPEDLLSWTEVAMLNISGRVDISIPLLFEDDEKRFYVQHETRDMCADFGRFNSTNDTDWSAHTLTDDLFKAMTNGSNVTFADPDTAASWKAVGNVSVCMGNLHGMPSYAPGVCGPIPALEELAKNSSEGTDVPCAFPPIELPVCGNPYYALSNGSGFGTSIRRPTVPGQQFAHYCSPTTSDEGWFNKPSVGLSASLLECEGDTMTVAQRQVFCAEGGSLGLRGKRVAVERPSESVCNKDTATCLAFAGDAIWPLEKVIAHADKTFDSGYYAIVVVPVNATVMHNLPLSAAFEDLSKANRFVYDTDAQPLIPSEFPITNDTISSLATPKLADSLCKGPTKDIEGVDFSSDPLMALSTSIESMRATTGSCKQGPGLPAISCGTTSYCVPRLITVSGRAMTDCIPEAEMFPPIVDASIEIRKPGVKIIPSSRFGRRIKFGAISGSPPATCVRITARAQGFSISSVEFDQSNCNGLAESLRTAIVYSGSSAVNSIIEDVIIRGYPGAGVAYTGNRDDGDNPYLTVSEPIAGAADAMLSGLSFVVSDLVDSALGGIVAASARTFGTQVVTQRISGECSDIRRNFSSNCTTTSVCPRSSCPYPRTTQQCVSNSSVCPSMCAFVLSEDGVLACSAGYNRTEFRSQTYSMPSRLSTDISRGVSVIKALTSSRCLQSTVPFGLVSCDPADPGQQWFVQSVQGESHRINPAGRPYSCFAFDFNHNTTGLFPCDACDASTEETTSSCASTKDYSAVVFDGNLSYKNVSFVRVAYSDANRSLGVSAYPNGSCALTGGGVWDDCRTECVRVNESTCNSISFVGGLLAACAHSGSLAAIQTPGGCADSSTAYDVIQGGTRIPATAKCVGGEYVLVSHGLGYVGGAATVNSDSVKVWVATAIVQPYDELTAVSGTGVSVLNLTALTGLFDRMFEARLSGADRTTTWYLIGAVLAFATGIVLVTIACLRFSGSRATQRATNS